MKKILKISGLDCPVCAEALQGDIQKIKGVNAAQVDYVTQTIVVEVENEDVIKKVIKTANNFEEVKVLEGGRYVLKEEKHKKEWLQITLAGLLLCAGILWGIFLKNICAWAVYLFYGGAYLTVGYPVLLSTVKNLAKGRIFDENFLMTVASLGAMALGEFIEGVAVMLLYQLGELLQSLAVGASRKSVAELMQLKSDRAVKLQEGAQMEVSPEALRVGDIVLVKAGEKAPADGVLLGEIALLDKKSLTGEAEPVQVTKAEEILSGSINAGNAYEMQILRPYEESAVARILDMVENATANKAKPEKFIAKFSKYYTPIVCILALILALVAPLVGGLLADGRLYFKDLPRFVNSALTFLVISCPCALVISVPLTYFSGIGVCAKQGILVKGATHLDCLAQADIFAFDKTGTLTKGDFTVRFAEPIAGVSEAELLSIAAAMEKGSAHPIAKAFAGIETALYVKDLQEFLGKGLSGLIDGEEVLLGGEKWLRERGINLPKAESVYSSVYIAKRGKYLGRIEIGDRLKEEASEALIALKKLGITRTVMLTGDRHARAKVIANEVGMYEVKAELLPHDKLVAVEKLKMEGRVAYVGDGINDAPVMTASGCALSMGKIGSAAAVEAADIVLLQDDLRGIPKGVRIARKTRAIVLQNVLFSIGMKGIFMALGALGVLPLWLAVFADVGVMLLAVLNSFRVGK